MVTVLDSSMPCLNFLGKGQGPGTIATSIVDMGAGTDPVVEAYTANAVYDWIGMSEVFLPRICKTYVFNSILMHWDLVGLLLLETLLMTPILTLLQLVWKHVTVAADVEKFAANGIIVDQQPDLCREFKETGSCKGFGGSALSNKCQSQLCILCHRALRTRA